MVDRGRVLAAVRRSQRLGALASHVFRPLAWQLDKGKDEDGRSALLRDLDA